MSRIAGYAAIFDAPDRGGDIVRKGAFARITGNGAAKAGVPLLWQHDAGRRIGFVESLSEDERGLRVIAQLDGDQQVMAGAGLSFGYPGAG
jgi:HK97 family phage prohead protease